MINWNQFTVDNGAITDLRELLFLTVYDDPDIDLTIKNETGVTNGKKLGYIDSMGDVGEARSGCDPQYSKVNVTGIQKEWELGDWEIAMKSATMSWKTPSQKTRSTPAPTAHISRTPPTGIRFLCLFLRRL